MTLPPSAPYNGDDENLTGKAARAYFLYGWQEIKANREPDDTIQAIAAPLPPDDTRSPYRIYADSLMQTMLSEYVPDPVQIIDIGCGSGDYARLFKTHTGTYHGIDIVESPRWDNLQEESRGWPLNVVFHQMPAEDLATLDMESNFSLSSSSLEHVNDPDAAIRGLAARTQPGSYGLHIVPAPWTLFTYGRHGWRRFSAARLKTLFENAGFECVRLYRLGGVPSMLVFFLWYTCLEEGYALQNVTLSALPTRIYQLSYYLYIRNARSRRPAAPLYRAMLKLALQFDRYLPKMATGYAILVRRIR